MLLAIAGAGCSSPKASPPHGPAATTAAAQTTLVPTTAPGAITAAAVAAATRLFSGNPTQDAGLDAAWLRCRVLLTPALTAQLLHQQAAPEDATWRSWRTHQATVSVHADPVADDAPTDTATLAVRRLALVLTAHGRNGWADRTRLGVVLTLNRAPNGRWLVGGIHVDI
jgi:hypothetical protein